MKTIILSLMCLYFSFNVRGQESESISDLKYLKSQIENNYAGFYDKVTKNQETYNQLIDDINSLTKASSDTLAIESKIKDYINFFNDDHLQYYNVSEEMEKRKNKIVDEVTFYNPSITFNSDATIITIPSFERDYKKQLDSILEASNKKIVSRNILIIDIRNNEGGIDATFRSLLPYIYTKPFKSYSVEIRVSDDNIEYYKNLVNSETVEDSDREVYKSLLVKMENTNKDFVNMFDSITYQESFDKIVTRPNKVGILFNSKTASSAEEFLLRVRQSSKVTLFGEATAGTLDYSNPRIVWMPSKKRVMAIPLSRSMRLPDNGIDKTGITPDIVLEDNEKSIKNLIQQIKK